MFANIGIPGLILIVVIALIIFGPSKLPQIGRALGTSIKEFKKSTQGLTSDIVEEIDEVKNTVKNVTDLK